MEPEHRSPWEIGGAPQTPPGSGTVELCSGTVMRDSSVLVFCSLVASGCMDSGTTCTTDNTTSVRLFVVDEAGLEVDDATATYVVAGASPEACEGPYETMFNCAWDAPGEFTVTAEAPGYEPASDVAVVVEDGLCHVVTRELTLVLVPETEREP